MAADVFSYGGANFLVVTDIKSGWPKTFHLGWRLDAGAVIDALRETLCNTATPTVPYCDSGSNFTAHIVSQFLQQWGVHMTTSSPHYPQSNWHAESAVKAMKRLVKRCWNMRTQSLKKDKWAHGLLQFRNTPRGDGRLPAQVLYGHPCGDALPVHKWAFATEWQKATHDADERGRLAHEATNFWYDHTAREHPELRVGTRVVIQDLATKRWVQQGVVTERGTHRAYLIRLPSGRVWRRNQRFIRPCDWEPELQANGYVGQKPIWAHLPRPAEAPVPAAAPAPAAPGIPTQPEPAPAEQPPAVDGTPPTPPAPPAHNHVPTENRRSQQRRPTRRLLDEIWFCFDWYE